MRVQACCPNPRFLFLPHNPPPSRILPRSHVRATYARNPRWLPMLELRFQGSSQMQRAGAGLRKIVMEAIRRAPAEEAPVLAWAVVCGPGVAARTRALECAAGILRVEVPDRAWRTELTAFVPRYLAALREFGNVSHIKFVIPGEIETLPRSGPVDKEPGTTGKVTRRE